MSFKIRVVLWIPVISISVLGCILYFAEHLGISLPLSYTDRTTILLTSALTMFAAIEGYSTYMHVELENRKNKIEDARNELEKAYGPIYTLLNAFDISSDPKKECYLTPEYKDRLDEIVARYPYVFPDKIYSFWQDTIRNLKPAFLDGHELTPSYYEIPLTFRDMINEEYDRRVKKYNELLKK